MEIEIINSHFSALETKDLLQDNRIPFTFNNEKGELDENHRQVLIMINTINDLFKLQQNINDIIITDYKADNGATVIYLLIYDDYLE